LNRSHLSAAVFAWGPAFEQSSLEYGERTVRQLLRWPNQAIQEYWPYLLGGVVVILLLRAYLRK
jgi:hypothetical protein